MPPNVTLVNQTKYFIAVTENMNLSKPEGLLVALGDGKKRRNTLLQMSMQAVLTLSLMYLN